MKNYGAAEKLVPTNLVLSFFGTDPNSVVILIVFHKK